MSEREKRHMMQGGGSSCFLDIGLCVLMLLMYGNPKPGEVSEEKVHALVRTLRRHCIAFIRSCNTELF